MKTMRVVYLAHPLGSVEPERTWNIERAKRWYKFFLANYDAAIIADWLITATLFDESRRDLGMNANAALLPCVDEVWLCGGRISNGMAAEVAIARQYSIPVYSFIDLGTEPPNERVEGVFVADGDTSRTRRSMVACSSDNHDDKIVFHLKVGTCPLCATIEKEQ